MSGRVTRRKVCAPEAPSDVEASSIALSIWCREAMPERWPAGMERAVYTMTIARAPPMTAPPPASGGMMLEPNIATGLLKVTR